jgi:signal transduction histidine kinase
MPLQPKPEPGKNQSSGDFGSAVEAWRMVLQADTKLDQMSETVNGLMGQLWQRSRQMMRVRALAEYLSIAGRPKDLGDHLMGALYGELGCPHGAIWRLAATGFEAVASLRIDDIDLDSHMLPAPNPFPDSAILPFQAQWLDLETLPKAIQALRVDARTELYYLPFEFQSNLSGFAVLALPKARIFSESEQEFLSVIQRMTALVLDNTWLYRNLVDREEKLETLALHLHAQKEELALAHRTLRDVEATRLAFISFAGEALRNQLASQLGYLRLLMDGAGEEEERDAFLKGSNTLGSQMLEVLNDLVEWTKLAGGIPMEEPHALDLGPVIEELKMVIGTFPAKAHVLIDWPFTEGVPEIVTDPERLKQVLLNLLLRAQNDLDQGFIPFWIERAPMSLDLSLRMRMAKLDPALARAALSPHGFESGSNFAQGQVGAGLGLVMGQRMMRAVGGNLRVDPSDEGGSIISVDVPMA